MDNRLLELEEKSSLAIKLIVVVVVVVIYAQNNLEASIENPLSLI